MASRDEAAESLRTAIDAIAKVAHKEADTAAASTLRDYAKAANELAEAHAWLHSVAQPH